MTVNDTTRVFKESPKPATSGVVRPLKPELSPEVVHALHNPVKPVTAAPTKAASAPIAKKPAEIPPTNLGAKLAATVAKPTQTTTPTRSVTWASASIGGPVGASASGEVKSGLRQGLDWAREQHSNFQGGTVEWAKGYAKPALHALQHPVETLQASSQLSTNVTINPIVALPLGLVQGKSLDEMAREDLGEIKAIATNTVGDYQRVYQEHGVAGVAGYLAPDMVLAILTAGEGTGGRQLAGEVASSAVPVPGPEDLPGAVDAVRAENAKN